MADLKISVIIPVYNVEKYIHQCVDSVLCQTYKNIEVILADDGSTDNCPLICDEYAEKDGRVKVIHKQNGGLSSARNAGMKIMTGDYALFLDSDDYWVEKVFLDNIVKEKLSSACDVVIFGYTKDINLLQSHKRNTEFENLFSVNDKCESLKQLITNNKYLSSACDKIVNTRLYKLYDMMFLNGVLSEDIDWSARILLYADSFQVYDRYVYFYRENHSSITHNISKKHITDLMNNIIRIVSWSDNIKNEDYYEWYMNYCSYQYITLLNIFCNVSKQENVNEEIAKMGEYSYLLNYHTNKKVKLVYLFNKIFGYRGMLKILKLYLKAKG